MSSVYYRDRWMLDGDSWRADEARGLRNQLANAQLKHIVETFELQGKIDERDATIGELRFALAKTTQALEDLRCELNLDQALIDSMLTDNVVYTEKGCLEVISGGKNERT